MVAAAKTLQPIAEAVDPAMHRQSLAACPRLPNDRGLADVHHLLDHVQLAQAVVPLLLAREPGQLALVFTPHFLDYVLLQ